jgi:hypothetical protein
MTPSPFTPEHREERTGEKKTVRDLVRDYFPDFTDEACDILLWEHTAFPFGDLPYLVRCLERFKRIPRGGDAYDWDRYPLNLEVPLWGTWLCMWSQRFDAVFRSGVYWGVWSWERKPRWIVWFLRTMVKLRWVTP